MVEKRKIEEIKVKIKYEKAKADATEQMAHAYSKLVLISGAILIWIALILTR